MPRRRLRGVSRLGYEQQRLDIRRECWTCLYAIAPIATRQAAVPLLLFGA